MRLITTGYHRCRGESRPVRYFKLFNNSSFLLCSEVKMELTWRACSLQADLGGLPVHCPTMPETTALGAAVAAAIGVGLKAEGMTAQTMETFMPTIGPEERDQHYRRWKRAVRRSIGWTLPHDEGECANGAEIGLPERVRNHLAFATFFFGALTMLAFSQMDWR